LSSLGEETPAELAPPDAETWAVQALEQRPDLRQWAEVVHSEEQNVRAARSRYLPRVGVGAAWGFDRTSNLHYESDDQASAAGIEVYWELYSGGARAAKIRQAEAARSEAAANVQRLRLSIIAEVRKLVLEVLDAQQRIPLHRESVATARENRRLIQTAYLAGKESQIRLNEAQRDFVTAEAEFAAARIRLRQAWSNLRAAAGAESAEIVPP
jgi:outer membrane protein TolC